MKSKHYTPLASVLSAVVIFNFSGCKYEDGPAISLRTKKARLIGEWEAKFVAGERFTDGSSFILEFEKDGDLNIDVSYSYYGYTYDYSIKGEWEWEDGKRVIEISLDNVREEWEITKLTNSELEFEDEERDKWEFEKD